jgi:hypothetical protein
MDDRKDGSTADRRDETRATPPANGGGDRERVAAAVWRRREEGPGGGPEALAAAVIARRQGAIRAGIGLVAAAVIYVLWNPVAAVVVAGIAGLSLILALASPLGAYARIDRWMAGFAHVVGTAVTWLLMPVMFYLVFLPVGLVLRSVGRLRLIRSLDPEAASYWIVRTEDRRDGDEQGTVHDYRRQF